MEVPREARTTYLYNASIHGVLVIWAMRHIMSRAEHDDCASENALLSVTTSVVARRL